MDLLGAEVGPTLYHYSVDWDSNRIMAVEDRMEKINEKIRKVKKTSGIEVKEPLYGPGIDILT